MQSLTRTGQSVSAGALSLLAAAIVCVSPISGLAVELRAAFASACPTTEYPGEEGKVEALGVAAAVVAPLVGYLVDAGVAALKKAVNPGNSTLESQFLEQGLFVYKGSGLADPNATVTLSPNMGCIVVAVGSFAVADSGVQGWHLPFKSDRPEPATEDVTSSNWRVANALALKGPAKLSLYLEAARVFSGDKTAVTWRPVRLYVGGYLNESYWAGKSRSTAVEVRLYKPGKKEAFYSQEFDFEEVTRPVDKNAKHLADRNVGTWSVLPGAPPVPANLKPTPEGKEFDPYTLEVRIVEAPKPYALAQAFASEVEKNKEGIKKEIIERVDPNAKATTDLTAEGATLDAVSGYLAALKAAIAECAAGKVTDDPGKLNCAVSRDKALIAKRKAELACKSNPAASCAGLPEVPSNPAP